MSDSKLARLNALLATPLSETTIFVKSAGKEGENMKFGRVHIEDVAAIILNHPNTEPFFLGMRERGSADIMDFIRLIVGMGSKVVSKVIALGTEFTDNEDELAAVTAAIHRFNDADRFKLLMSIQRGANWEDFFGLLLQSFSEFKTTKDGEEDQEALDAAIGQIQPQAPSPQASVSPSPQLVPAATASAISDVTLPSAWPPNANVPVA